MCNLILCDCQAATTNAHQLNFIALKSKEGRLKAIQPSFCLFDFLIPHPFIHLRI
jgi:hypothetical protein